MSSKIFKGCGTALVTPFREGAVDYEVYASLVRRQIAEGVDFLVPLGTTAETPALTSDERKKLLALARENAPGTPLLVGCGSNSPEATLQNIRELSEVLVPEAWLVVVPFYNKPGQEGIYQYFKKIASESKSPVFVYNVPGRTGAGISAETVLRLAHDCPNIVGIKEASGNYQQVSEILSRRPEGFTVLSGDDALTFPFMATGAEGVISVASNLAPAEVSAMCHYALAGKWEEARRLHFALSPLFRNCFVESSPVPVKAGMALRNLCSAELRLPLVEAADKTKELMSLTIDTLWK